MEIQRNDSLHQRYCYRNMCPPKNSSQKTFVGIVKGADMKFSGGGLTTILQVRVSTPKLWLLQSQREKIAPKIVRAFPC